jgi:hypothetical protein
MLQSRGLRKARSTKEEADGVYFDQVWARRVLMACKIQNHWIVERSARCTVGIIMRQCIDL